MDGLAGVERLEAIEDIKVLKSRRDRAVDAQDWETYAQLHAPDHRTNNDGHPPFTTAAAMIENLRHFLAGMKTVHHSHTPQITFESPTKASGIWSLEDYVFWEGDDEWMHGFGYYFETYEKRDGHWVFTSRRLQRTHVRSSPGAMARLRAAREREGA